MPATGRSEAWGIYELGPGIGPKSHLVVWRRDVGSEPFALRLVAAGAGPPEWALRGAEEAHRGHAETHARTALAADIAPRLLALIGTLPENDRPHVDVDDPEQVRDHRDRVVRAAAEALRHADPFARAYSFQRNLDALHADRRLVDLFDDPSIDPKARAAEFAEIAAREGEAYLCARSPSCRSATGRLKAEWERSRPTEAPAP